MAGLTLADAEAKLATWLAAEDKCAEGQSYSIGDRALTRADLEEIGNRITFWDNKVKSLSRGGIRTRRAVPLG